MLKEAELALKGRNWIEGECAIYRTYAKIFKKQKVK